MKRQLKIYKSMLLFELISFENKNKFSFRTLQKINKVGVYAISRKTQSTPNCSLVNLLNQLIVHLSSFHFQRHYEFMNTLIHR